MRLLDKLLAYTPKQIFLLDAFGAVASGLLTIYVIARFPDVFGFPCTTCFYLSAMAFTYAVFSIWSASTVAECWRIKMRIIGCANLMYICMTICLVFIWKDSVTLLGLMFFGFEAVLVTSLGLFEIWYSRYKQT